MYVGIHNRNIHIRREDLKMPWLVYMNSKHRYLVTETHGCKIAYDVSMLLNKRCINVVSSLGEGSTLKSFDWRRIKEALKTYAYCPYSNYPPQLPKLISLHFISFKCSSIHRWYMRKEKHLSRMCARTG